MSKKWKIALAVSAVAIALLVGGVAVTGYALAQGPTRSGPWGDSFPGPWMERGHGPDGPCGGMRGSFGPGFGSRGGDGRMGQRRWFGPGAP